MATRIKPLSQAERGALYTVAPWLDDYAVVSQRTGPYLPYEKSRVEVHALHFKNWDAWRRYTRTPAFPSYLPTDPRGYYEKQTPGFKFTRADWLGASYVRGRSHSRITTTFLSYTRARAFVCSKHFKNWDEWRQFTKSPKFPKNLPKDPRMVYQRLKPGFRFSRHDWLGI